MEKFMKFPMYRKETTDEKYHNESIFRAVNFETDSEDNKYCSKRKEISLRVSESSEGESIRRTRKNTIPVKTAAAVPMQKDVRRQKKTGRSVSMRNQVPCTRKY